MQYLAEIIPIPLLDDPQWVKLTRSFFTDGSSIKVYLLNKFYVLNEETKLVWCKSLLSSGLATVNLIVVNRDKKYQVLRYRDFDAESELQEDTIVTSPIWQEVLEKSHIEVVFEETFPASQHLSS